MTRKLGTLAALLAVIGLVSATAGAATTSVTITSPKAGQSISLKKNPYVAIAGGVSFAPSSAGTTTFYLRRDGCGTSNDNPHLSTASGTTSTTLSATVAIGSNQRHRLRGASAFAGLFKAGRRLNGAHLQLLASPAERSVGRVGFVIGKKLLAGAVERNYLRRLLREAVRQRRS